jgi:hypothetical protein
VTPPAASGSGSTSSDAGASNLLGYIQALYASLAPLCPGSTPTLHPAGGGGVAYNRTTHGGDYPLLPAHPTFQNSRFSPPIGSSR